MLLWKKEIFIIFGFFYIIHQNFLFGNFPKRQLCFPRERIFLSFLVCLHNPSNFLFGNFPKRQFCSSRYMIFSPFLACLHNPSFSQIGNTLLGHLIPHQSHPPGPGGPTIPDPTPQLGIRLSLTKFYPPRALDNP